MRIFQVKIRNFRGIRELVWTPNATSHCIIGPGDTGKSTVLDAIEFALSPRFTVPLSDADFFNSDPSSGLEIEVTIGDIPPKLGTQEKFGLHKRGWTHDGQVRDEPADDDSEALTIRFSCDLSLEPEWAVVTDRSEPKHLSVRDRALLPFARIGPSIDRMFTWGRGTPLWRLTADPDGVAPLLANATRTMRKAMADADMPDLESTAERVVAAAREFGARLPGTPSAAIDPALLDLGTGAIGLHMAGIPVRAAGLGTKRLAAVAMQFGDAARDTVLLVDEVEHALEPYRLLRLLEALIGHRSDPSRKPQVLMCTHSPLVLQELPCQYLSVMRNRQGSATIGAVGASSDIQAFVRSSPALLLAPRILVCEGKTEFGLCRALELRWEQQTRRNFAAAGVAIAEGGGYPKALKLANQLTALGYEVCLLLDSDVPLSPEDTQRFQNAGGRLLLWTGEMSTEERLCHDAPASDLEAFVAEASILRGADSVLDAIDGVLHPGQRPGGRPTEFRLGDWLLRASSEQALRAAVGQAAKKGEWFKRIDWGETLGAIACAAAEKAPTTELARTLKAVTEWVNA